MYRCRMGAEKAEVALAKSWPASSEKPVEQKALSRIRICGTKLGEQVLRPDCWADLRLRNGFKSPFDEVDPRMG